MENEYYRRWINECAKTKALTLEIEKLKNKLHENKEIKEMASFHKRENARYDKGIKAIRKAYDDLKEKTEFLETSHKELIALFNRYLLLDDKFSNVKLNESSKNQLICEARAILHKENEIYKIGKTFISKND